MVDLIVYSPKLCIHKSWPSLFHIQSCLSSKKQNLWLRHRLFCEVKGKNKHFASKVVRYEPPDPLLSTVSSSYSKYECDWLASHFHRYSLIREHDRGRKHLPKMLAWTSNKGKWCVADKNDVQPSVLGRQHQLFAWKLQSSSLAHVGRITAVQSCRTPLFPLLCFKGRGFSKFLRK